MLLITFALVLAWGINNPAQVGGILDRLLGLVSPFLLGFCFAFVLNILPVSYTHLRAHET